MTVVNGNEILLVDSKVHSLLKMDIKSNVLMFSELDSKKFPQPEGICISPEGNIYISSEGTRKGYLYKMRLPE